MLGPGEGEARRRCWDNYSVFVAHNLSSVVKMGFIQQSGGYFILFK